MFTGCSKAVISRELMQIDGQARQSHIMEEEGVL